MAGAIFGFGDLPQRIARLEGIKLRFRRLGGGRGIVMDRGGARRIAARRRGFLCFPGRGGAAREDDGTPFGLGFGFRDIATVFLRLILQSLRGNGGRGGGGSGP